MLSVTSEAELSVSASMPAVVSVPDVSIEVVVVGVRLFGALCVIVRPPPLWSTSNVVWSFVPVITSEFGPKYIVAKPLPTPGAPIVADESVRTNNDTSEHQALRLFVFSTMLVKKYVFNVDVATTVVVATSVFATAAVMLPDVLIESVVAGVRLFGLLFVIFSPPPLLPSSPTRRSSDLVITSEFGPKYIVAKPLPTPGAPIVADESV